MIHPRLELLDDWHRFRLLEQWEYEWLVEDGRSRRIVIPEGFVTDLASVPKFAHWWIGRADLRAAALPHDLIYGFAGHVPGKHFTIDGEPCEIPWSRYDADRLFGRMMRSDGVGMAKRRAAYRAVRLFGWWPWQEAEHRRGRA